MKKIILASSSPRRREILKTAGLDFDIITPDCDEHTDKTDPSAYVMELAGIKCRAGRDLYVSEGKKYGDVFIVGSDTIVYHDGAVLGKPSDKEDALKMLRSLSGNMHEVYTGVCVLDTASEKTVSFFEKTDVEFYDISSEELCEYISTNEPMDKAGAYGIQGRGVFLVKKINGDYFNVMGLPVGRLIRVLKSF